MNAPQRLAALVIADAAVLGSGALDLGRFNRLATHLAAPRDWIARVGADSAVADLAATALWLAAAWLALGLLAAAGAGLPGALGRCGRRLARLVLPAAIHRLAAGVAGIGIALVPAAAGAAAPSAAAPPVVATFAHRASAPPIPIWPTDDAVPAPRWPSTEGPAGHRSAHHRAPTDSSAAPANSVVVQQGDSLWSIARSQLSPGAPDARIARTWPSWYAANRSSIGADPALLRPGQILHVPAHLVEETRS